MKKTKIHTKAFGDGEVELREKCTAVEFYNGWDVTISINGRPIPADKTWTIAAQPNQTLSGNTFTMIIPTAATVKKVLVSEIVVV